MANYNVDIAVALKGAKQLTSFNREVKATSTNIDAFAKRLKSAAKDQTLLVRSFDNLNKVLSEATKNFNAAASGSQQQFAAARQLITAEKNLNKEYQERERVLQSITLKGQRSSILPGQSLFGQSVTPKGGASGRSRQILQEEQALQAALARMGQRFTGAGNITPMELTGQSESIFRGQSSPVEARIKQTLENRKQSEQEVAKIRERLIKKEEKLLLTRRKILKEEITTRTRILRQNQFGNVNPSMGGFRAFSQRADQISASVAARANRPGIGSLIRNQFSEGGSFAATRGQRLRGAASNALIGGGFPLLFGQGAIGAAGGGIGGALGGALGGGFGFGLSIAGTALAQRIQETIDFRKSIDDLNRSIEATGGTSTFTAKQVAEFAKSMKMTKEEALQALKAFEQFGAAARISLSKVFGDEATFNMLASLKDNAAILSQMDQITKNLGFEQAGLVLEILNTQGARAAENKILELTIKKNKALNLQIKERVGAEGRLRKIRKEQRAEDELKVQQEIDNAKTILELQIKRTEELRKQSIIKAPTDELQRLLDPLNQVNALAQSIGSSFQDSFKGIITGSMTAQAALRNLFMRTADHFADMAAQILANQIKAGILGLFSNFLTPSLPLPSTQQLVDKQIATHGNTVPGGSFNISPSLNKVRGTAFKKKANGGPVMKGGSYIVGERGPEMFSPGVSGMITPNHELGGSTNIVVNVDASGSSVEGNDIQANQFGNVLAAAIQAELINQKRSGGLLSNT